ncbi:MAG: NapC/NirT family cytochrome c [bacterium]
MKEKRKPLVIVSSLCIFLILLLWVVNTYVLNTASFCSSCHMIQSACDTWQISQHKPEYTNNSCNACHLEPGIVGSIKTTAYGIKNTYTFFFGIEEDDIKAKDPVYCTRSGCHTKMEESMDGKRVRVNHGFHMNMKYACVVCHDRVAHEEYGMAKNLSMMMDFCFACHDDEIAPRTNCSVCHIYQYNMLKGIKTKEEISGVTSSHFQEEGSCQKCHQSLQKVDQKICLNCHNEDRLNQYQRVQTDLAKRISEIKVKIEEVSGRFTRRKSKEYDPTWEQFLSLFQGVQENYSYLEKDNSRGAHNIELTQRIVKNVEENIQRILYFLYNYQDIEYQQVQAKLE